MMFNLFSSSFIEKSWLLLYWKFEATSMMIWFMHIVKESPPLVQLTSAELLKMQSKKLKGKKEENVFLVMRTQRICHQSVCTVSTEESSGLVWPHPEAFYSATPHLQEDVHCISSLGVLEGPAFYLLWFGGWLWKNMLQGFYSLLYAWASFHPSNMFTNANPPFSENIAEKTKCIVMSWVFGRSGTIIFLLGMLLLHCAWFFKTITEICWHAVILKVKTLSGSSCHVYQCTEIISLDILEKHFL